MPSRITHSTTLTHTTRRRTPDWLERLRYHCLFRHSQRNTTPPCSAVQRHAQQPHESPTPRQVAQRRAVYTSMHDGLHDRHTPRNTMLQIWHYSPTLRCTMPYHATQQPTRHPNAPRCKPAQHIHPDLTKSESSITKCLDHEGDKRWTSKTAHARDTRMCLEGGRWIGSQKRYA